MKKYICKQCHVLHDGKYGSGQFCSSHCAHSYSSSINKKCKNKKISQSLLLHFYLNKAHKIKICKVCGQEKCQYPNICKSQFIRNKSPNLAKLGFDFSTYGSKNIYKEYLRLQNKIKTEYFNGINIMKKYNIPSSRTIDLLFKFLNITRKSHSQAAIDYIKRQSSTFFISKEYSNYKFKAGRYTDYFNQQHYYRSSLELEYYKKLDQQRILFKSEYLKIPYFDTQKQKYRIAIPDIFLPKANTIIEIKSIYTYDQQEMIDKAKAYRKLGYTFYLYINNKHYKRCIAKYRLR